ncbi:MAG: L,D-transpeptidase [Myxococcales bacterium FL481]|nr:MAG: L,D-transpeptidase [Myxococcales bacterium FL481]
MSLLALGLLAATSTGVRAIDPVAFDLAVEPTTIAFIETREAETVIRGRPWVPHPRLGTVRSGTRLAVRGQVASRDEKGCHGKPWYAVQPLGFVCSHGVRPTQTEPSTDLAPVVPSGRTLPYRYARVRSDAVPVYPSADAIRDGLPAGLLAKGMSLAIDDSRTVEGRTYLVTTSGRWVSREDVGWLGEGSTWQGVRLRGQHVGPSFAWTRPTKTSVYAAPSSRSKVLRKLPRRSRVPLLAHNGAAGRSAMWRIDDTGWVAATALNEVVVREPPEGLISADDPNRQWIDVDVGEQVLVAYRGRSPVFATMISSGRAHPTPLGNYPIWAKVTDMKMGNQAYEDKAYLVEGVPWVLLFQGHNALHGAYWHDSFGTRKSHGCVNLSPKDARWVFNWTLPILLEGWTGFLPGLERSITVHVHDSHESGDRAFSQQRPIGPPDREEEAIKLEEAEARRAEAALPTLDNPPSLDEVLSGIRRAPGPVDATRPLPSPQSPPRSWRRTGTFQRRTTRLEPGTTSRPE